MKPSTRYSLLMALGMSVAVIAAPQVLEVKRVPTPVTSIDTRSPAADWDGSTGLIERRGAATFFGTAAAFLGAAVVGTCSAPFAALIGPVPCVATTAAAALSAFIAFAGGIIAATTKRDIERENDMAQWMNFEYPSIEGGMHMRHQVEDAFDNVFGDGHPVHIASTKCEGNEVCHKIWYSKSVINHPSLSKNRTIRRIHVTPQDYDFRAPPTQTRSLLPRQSEYENDGSSSTDDGSTTYSGGYVWEEGSVDTLTEDYNEGTNDFTTDILNEMNSQNADNGKFNDEGVYCMDFAATDNSAAGTLGYLWYYSDPADYPSSNEEALLNTCGEEAAD